MISRSSNIAIPYVDDIKGTISDFSTLISANEFNYKALEDIQNVDETYRELHKISKIFKSQNDQFHVHQIKRERTEIVVLKNFLN